MDYSSHGVACCENTTPHQSFSVLHKDGAERGLDQTDASNQSLFGLVRVSDIGLLLLNNAANTKPNVLDLSLSNTRFNVGFLLEFIKAPQLLSALM